MQAQSISFGSLVPEAGFRWVYRDDSDRWHLREPPEDWADVDYQAAALGEELATKPDLSDRFYVAAGTDECLRTHAEKKTDFGTLTSEPDLYLRFASERPTPSLILELANQYGLLRYTKSHFSVRRGAARDLIPSFEERRTGLAPKLLFITGEKAFEWLRAFAGARFMLQAWNDLKAGGPAEMSSYLEDAYNYAMGGSLTFQVKMDERTGQVRSEIIASSLADAIEVQWGMSLVANVLHRQCPECAGWFAVHPGGGRPDKQFCSDACRMRAYRKRKAQRNSGSSNRSSSARP